MSTARLDVDPKPPVSEETPTRIRVAIATERVGRLSLDEADQAILNTLAGGEGLPASEIEKRIGLTPRATRMRRARVVGRGVGTGPQNPTRCLHRSE